MIGGISDYGLLSYIISIILVYSCCIRFISLESLYFLILLGAGIGNVAYGWGILMIFTCSKYFKTNRINYDN